MNTSRRLKCATPSGVTTEGLKSRTTNGTKRNSDGEKLLSAETPHDQRHKMQLRIRKMAIDHENDSSSSASGSDSEDSEPEQSTSHDEHADDETKAQANVYFNAQGKSLTSNQTLASLRQDLLELDLRQHFSQVPLKHRAEIEKLAENYQNKFHMWTQYLKNGFNVLLYGVGSKISLMEQLRETLIDDYTVLEVKGYLPDLTINTVLKSILDILEHKGTFSKWEEQLNFIKKSFKDSDDELCLLIHNIEGPSLRSEKAQSILCNLAQCAGIHIVASIDNVRTSLLWDTGKLANFKWVWEDVTTFLPYTEETAHENSVLVTRTGTLALNSATHVFNSLTPNAKGIFLLLAKNQLEKMEANDTYIGMPFQECYSLCRGAFLVNSQLTLNSQLTEFKDHKLLKVKKGGDGGEYLLITLDANTLSAFVENHAS